MVSWRDVRRLRNRITLPREEEHWSLEEAETELFEVLIPERAARDGVSEEEAQRLILEEWHAEWERTPRGIELVGR